MIPIGESLVTARRARGLTQEELAAAVGITQAALSRYENDLREPDNDVLGHLAHALGVTENLLRRAGRLRGAIAVDPHMRRQATAKPSVWRTLEAKLNIYRVHARLLAEEVSIRAENSVPTYDPLEVEPKTAAYFVRMQWRMPVGPIRRLTQWLEAAGCLIIEEDFGTTRVDGLSQWIDEYPVILINQRMPTDRKRLTLAHELGHLCLHSTYISEEIEREANAFAAELLMPGDVIRPQLKTLTVGKLHDLKREWCVSMQALIERARDLALITPAQRTNLSKSLSARGWRTREPLSEEIPPEYPQLTHHIGETLAAKGFAPQEIAQLAGFSPDIAHHPFAPQPARLRMV